MIPASFPILRGLDSEPALMPLDVPGAAPALDPLPALGIACLRAFRDSAARRWAMTSDARRTM